MSIVDYIYGRIRRGIITFVNIVTLAHRDWPFYDYETSTVTELKQNYTVGDNNKDLIGTQSKLFISKSTLILCTVATYIRFNRASDVETLLAANTWFTFKHNIRWMEWRRVTVTGNIYIYCEGVLPQEARTPE